MRNTVGFSLDLRWILFQRRAVVGKFLLVGQNCQDHVKWSTRERYFEFIVDSSTVFRMSYSGAKERKSGKTVLAAWLHIDDDEMLTIFVRLFVWVYGITTFVGYLMLNPFLYKWTVLFQTIRFRKSTLFNCQKYFYFKLFSLVKQYNSNNFVSYKHSFCLRTVECQKKFLEQFSLV